MKYTPERKEYFVKDNARQLRVFLENRNIEYSERQSESTRSIYFRFTITTKELCVRISDHPSTREVDYSIHPKGKDDIQRVRQRIRHTMKMSPRYKGYNIKG